MMGEKHRSVRTVCRIFSWGMKFTQDKSFLKAGYVVSLKYEAYSCDSYQYLRTKYVLENSK